jgi:hypothetical protein
VRLLNRFENPTPIRVHSRDSRAYLFFLCGPQRPLRLCVKILSVETDKLFLTTGIVSVLLKCSSTQAVYDNLLAELRQRANVFVKLSSVIHRVNGQLSTDLASHRERLDRLMDVFGEDRVLFGSDWPNSDGVAPLDRVVAIVKAYFMTKPRSVAEKYFWKNSVAAYKWIKRASNQPSLA